MEKMSGIDLHMEASEGGLKELVMRWFTETQAPLILNNGNFPNWFQGFFARKDAEDLLRDKALGCFLIRLSDKAIGYILSYKGHDRCRHFVITQNQDGHFVISGDCQTYRSLAELIEHYKVCPIQPFGEHLTSSCYEVNNGELYDVVNYNAKEKPAVSVRALRTLWDQKHESNSNPGNNQKIQQQNDPPTVQPPAIPAKSKSRKLTGALSVDTTSISQGSPPIPKRGLPLGVSLSGFLPDTHILHPSETQTDPNRSQRLSGNTNPVLMSDTDSSYTTDEASDTDLCPPGISYSEHIQMEGRSRSLPKLNMEEEEHYSNHLSTPSFRSSASYSPTPVKRVTCQTYSLHAPRDGPRPSSSWSEQQGGGLETLKSNPLYHTSVGPEESAAQRGDGMYAEVPQRPTPAGLPDDTYEQIPGEAMAVQGNTYESLDDMKTKNKSTWGKHNMKWKKFLPDHKKK